MDLGIHVPEADLQQGLAVRPDVLVIGVAARVEDVSPTQAVALFKVLAGKLQTRILDFHKRAELLPRKMDLGRATSDKAAKAALADSQIDGLIHVPLDDALDYWGRAELVAKMTESLRGFASEAHRAKPSIRFGFRAPIARVLDVSAHKAALTARYATQWRALAGQGEKAQGSSSWEIPDEVAQYPVSLEEVRLTLISVRKFPLSRDS